MSESLVGARGKSGDLRSGLKGFSLRERAAATWRVRRDLPVEGGATSRTERTTMSRVLKAMYFEKADSDKPLVVARVHSWNMGLMAAGTIGLWLAWTPLVNIVNVALSQWYPYVPVLANH